ncbi:hypothetical protein GZ77_19680 [Endozoicomonas montiporae]|uniref:undecaprenyl-diphosphate phosphatase n=2 Tax=Endozoicomonas montiporae TaxID=1027273 RepID=A0A081N2N0_9GAMM|nr:phosphatase PAP2 family protein [Endozoicomonas montiporae]AMO57961.1 phosphoesterase, PA-phosphatase related [Endozoicomonas montiporae CL-33]KEQ12703.1 hypothetical protein GZ77_19680 [Endozoicomonas montiporae]
MDTFIIISSMQQHLAFVDAPVRALSTYGYSYYYLLVAAIVFWSGFTRAGGRLAMGTVTSSVVFGSCRHFFASPRPYWIYPELFNGMTEKSYGMPSGHTQNATMFWGLMAYSLKNRWFWLAAAALILLTGISRLYLGVHFPLQVAIGLMLGLTLLLLFILFEQRVIDFLQPMPAWKKITLTVFATFLPFVFILICREVLHIGSTSHNPLPYSLFLRFNGLLTGCAVGLLFTLPVTPSLRLFFTRAIPGTISVIVIWQNMPELNSLKDHPVQFYTARFGLYTSLALWATWLWPLLHQRLGAFRT